MVEERELRLFQIRNGEEEKRIEREKDRNEEPKKSTRRMTIWKKRRKEKR